MPTPVFPTCYQVEVRGLLFGQLIENVWHVQGPDPFDPTVAATIASTFQVGATDIMLSLSQDYQIGEVFVHNLAGGASGEFTLAIIPPQTGGIVQDSEPGCVAICISLRTAVSGRSTRGRKYFPGLGKGDVTGNLFSASRIGDMVTAVNTLIGTLDGAGTPMVIFSPTLNVITPVLTAAAVDGNVDAQRRRLTGRGR